MKTIISALLLFLASNVVHAGLTRLTWHSRANCINNESITWDATKPWLLQTASNHKKESWHFKIDPQRVTRRSAAIHWNEGFSGGWLVNGVHVFTSLDFGQRGYLSHSIID